MAVYTFGFALALILACSSAAPSQDVDNAIKVPTSCQGKRFCSIKPEGYDQLAEKINSVLPEVLVKQYADRDGGENVDLTPKLSPKEDWHNCPYETKTELMYMYNHDKNSTKIDIFVQTSLFKQYVDVVTCATDYIKNSEEQCFQDLGVSSYGMKSTCETSLATRTLYVYDMERSKVVQKSYDVPACCVCKVSYK